MNTETETTEIETTVVATATVTTRKNKKVSSYTKAQILIYICENWDGSPGREAKDCLGKTPERRKQDYLIISAQTGTPAASIELNIKGIVSSLYKELYGNYPAGSIVQGSHRPTRWHKKMAESLVKEELVS